MPGNEPTERELEILALLARGSTNGAIALALGITENTVKHHLRMIYAKLDVGSRTEAALWYERNVNREKDW
jgi:DNA-binding NarL/FixJ family response regulator